MQAQILQFLNNTYPVQLSSMEAVTNEMYRCHSVKGTFFARITNYKTYEEQLAEVNWTTYLFNRGVRVPEVVPTIQDSLVSTLLLNEEEKSVVLFQAAAGIHLPRAKWDKTIFRTLGQQMGRMHQVSKEYQQSEAAQPIPHWYDNDEYDFLKSIPAEERAIRDIAKDVLKQVRMLPKDEANYGIIHGDLWLNNTLVDSDSALTMIDWQDCERHYYVYDLAVPIYSALEFSFAGGQNLIDYKRAITKAITDGYKEEHPLSAEMSRQLPLFMRLKELFEYNLMHMYWNFEELSEEQVRILNLYRSKIEYMHT
ncbi:protein kinase [Paenibacillus sp. FSL R7-277]|uniref:phosphotransferase enzyme family protein n=1 Tax=Paenibacillus sp. FSL R7-277 TaxID=1227352 RepID=UPI0003E2698D|nr:phosphotransferase [Paenibacillus sp. FSL R7-277]ETT72468.1 protein kinase [Paenibacillus sp. FSL R7-277]